jgi:hypothetical protein
MIHGYSDHAAKERAFLAWVRTGIAVLGFGFVIEKFNLSVLAMATTSARPMRDPGYSSKDCWGRSAVTTGERLSRSEWQ